MKEKNLSLIVPLYNEEKRMTPFVKDLMTYSKKLKDYEVIFVDDGSTDNSVKFLENLIRDNKNSRIISYKPNRGKGNAVKVGIDNSIGRDVIFIDIDGSINPEEISKFLKALENSDVAIGDRYSNRKNIKQPIIREFTGIIFNAYVNFLFNIHVHDTLCGIKGFRKDVAKLLFKNLKSPRWVFDVEILYYIRKKKLKLIKLPIRWVHKEGTKMSTIDPIKMAFRLLILRLKLLKL